MIMSSAVPQSPNVSGLLVELLTASTDATRVWLRAEIDRTVDPMLHSIFKRLTTKLTNQMERTQSAGDGDCAQVHNIPTNLFPQPSTSSHFKPQFVNINNSHHQPNGPTTFDSISNQKLSSQSQSITIKENIETTTNEPMPTHQVLPSSSSSVVSNEEDQMAKESSYRHVKRPRMDTNQPNNAQAEMDSQFPSQSTDGEQLSDDTRQDEEGEPIESEQNGGIETQTTFENNFQNSSDESMVIQQEERERKANNAIGEDIATECTTNPIQANRHLQCSHCLKSFSRKFTLQRHLRVHTGERPFQCVQCDKRFSQRCILTNHQLIHKNIKHFQCDQCDKHFRQRGDLERHQLIHQNIKRFRCHECDKRFTLKHNFNNHLLIHSGERPFECRHCEKSFTQFTSRKTHEQAIHLHVKPHRCKQCGHTATHRSAIIKHIRMVHFGLPQTIKEQRALNIIDDRDPRELVEKV